MKNVIGLLLMCIVLASCNEKEVDNFYRGVEPVCEDKDNIGFLAAACSPPMPSWIITVNKESFPDNISLKLNDRDLFNECSGDSSPFVLTRDFPVMIEAEDFFSPGDEELKVEIVDLGSNCLGTDIFYSESNQSFEVTGEGRDKVLEFSID